MTLGILRLCRESRVKGEKKRKIQGQIEIKGGAGRKGGGVVTKNQRGGRGEGL